MSEEPEKSLEPLERVEEPEAYSGYGLYDPLDQYIGVVERLFVSEFGEPQYVRTTLKNGLFKRASILLPVERLARSTRYTGLVLQ
ncbi:hypothetical protein [Rubrobacter aplysinae]|uniref:hypothetical protein n=1 Tax=Rubrobacter aplysinae TaxID=909625 RepID=UPI00064C36C1|nr:hypothetical protein [Rubrobacter aplysinae]